MADTSQAVRLDTHLRIVERRAVLNIKVPFQDTSNKLGRSMSLDVFPEHTSMLRASFRIKHETKCKSTTKNLSIFSF
jgi:hypothetical protein